MHDFCFTIPYGLVLVGGGIVGYAKKGSLASLGGGLGTGFVLILAGYLSLKAFKKKKNSYLALILETGIVQFFWTVLEICTFVKFRFRYGVLLKFGGEKGEVGLFMIVVLLGNFGILSSLESWFSFECWKHGIYEYQFGNWRCFFFEVLGKNWGGSVFGCDSNSAPL